MIPRCNSSAFSRDTLHEGYCHRDFPCLADTCGAQKRNFHGVPPTKNAFQPCKWTDKRVRRLRRRELDPRSTCAHVHCHTPSPISDCRRDNLCTAAIVWCVAMGAQCSSNAPQHGSRFKLGLRLSAQKRNFSRHAIHKNAFEPHIRYA